MGIDIYLRWHGQDEAEEKAQHTGFSTEAGDVGYLREAYHGGPYVTKYFLSEAFNAPEHEAEIPAHVLKARVPMAVAMAIYRNAKLYHDDKDPAVLGDLEGDGLTNLGNALKNIFENEIKDSEHEDFVKQMTGSKVLEEAQGLIDAGKLPKYAQAFVDFADLAERKEKMLGRPCRIVASF